MERIRLMVAANVAGIFQDINIFMDVIRRGSPFCLLTMWWLQKQLNFILKYDKGEEHRQTHLSGLRRRGRRGRGKNQAHLWRSLPDDQLHAG